MKTRAAVAPAKGKPLEIMEVDLEGPKAGGMYRVRLAVPALPKEQLDRVIREMKGETNVVSFIAVVE